MTHDGDQSRFGDRIPAVLVMYLLPKVPGAKGNLLASRPVLSGSIVPMNTVGIAVAGDLALDITAPAKREPWEWPRWEGKG